MQKNETEVAEHGIWDILGVRETLGNLENPLDSALDTKRSNDKPFCADSHNSLATNQRSKLYYYILFVINFVKRPIEKNLQRQSYRFFEEILSCQSFERG